MKLSESFLELSLFLWDKEELSLGATKAPPRLTPRALRVLPMQSLCHLPACDVVKLLSHNSSVCKESAELF